MRSSPLGRGEASTIRGHGSAVKQDREKREPCGAWRKQIWRGQWGVRGEGNDRITSIHDTQQQAIDRARDIAINQQSEMLIQGRNGQIRERNSYGDDPFPPKG